MTSAIDEILEFNRGFVARREYEPFITDRFPDKKLVILTCMDTRLIELLPRAMNLRNGDVKIVKSAGAVVSHAFGSVMRSIVVAVHALGARKILVVGHHDCGMVGLNCDKILEHVRRAGVAEESIKNIEKSGVNLRRWLGGFEKVEDGVLASVDLIRRHPLIPTSVPVHGLIIHPTTGELERVAEPHA